MGAPPRLPPGRGMEGSLARLEVVGRRDDGRGCARAGDLGLVACRATGPGARARMSPCRGTCRVAVSGDAADRRSTGREHLGRWSPGGRVDIEGPRLAAEKGRGHRAWISGCRRRGDSDRDGDEGGRSRRGSSGRAAHGTALSLPTRTERPDASPKTSARPRAQRDESRSPSCRSLFSERSARAERARSATSGSPRSPARR